MRLLLPLVFISFFSSSINNVLYHQLVTPKKHEIIDFDYIYGNGYYIPEILLKDYHVFLDTARKHGLKTTNEKIRIYIAKSSFFNRADKSKLVGVCFTYSYIFSPYKKPIIVINESALNDDKKLMTVFYHELIHCLLGMSDHHKSPNNIMYHEIVDREDNAIDLLENSLIKLKKEGFFD